MPVPEKRSFNQAYTDARKNQELEFEWNGKMYNTRSKEEGHALWLTRMYRTPNFPTESDYMHNFRIDTKLNTLNRFTPINERGLSAKYDYLYEINRNLSPEQQLTIGDLDDWDPYGFKTSNWATFGSFPGYRQDLSMLKTNQIHDWIATVTNKMHTDNPYQLTSDRVAQWDPDGSKSKAIIWGETPEGLHNLYGKDWIHYNLASILNDGLKTDDPEFSKLFQYNPSSFSNYDPDGSIAASYMLYGQTPPSDGSAMWDKAREAELNRWKQHFNEARNHPTREEFRSELPVDPWDNDDSPSVSAAILKSTYNDRGKNWQYYVDQDPLAKKYQQLTKLDPRQITAQEFNDGMRLSRNIPLAILGGLYGGSTLLRGFSKLDRFATRNLLKWGSKSLDYSKMPRLTNAISRYGVLNGTMDGTFLGSSIHNYATNPNASWKGIALAAAPFALMSTPARKGLSWAGNAIVNGWRNPYVKGTILTGAGIGTGITLNNLYEHTYKPYRTKYLSSRIQTPIFNINSTNPDQYLTGSASNFNEVVPKLNQSEIKLP